MNSRQEFLNSRQEYMNSRNNDMMGGGSRNDMTSMRDLLGSRGDMRDSMMDRDSRDNFMVGGTRDMMQQRSMSMSNGSFGGGGGGGMNGGNEHNTFSRSMSYSSNMGGGSNSPTGPGGDGNGMKIGTWNEGRDNGSN